MNVFGPSDFRYIVDDGRSGTWYRIVTLVYTPQLDATANINQFLGCNILRRDCRGQIVAASPITYVGDHTPPTLIVQGQQDDTVPWQQALRLRDSLADAGRTVELILDPAMAHQLDPLHLEPITRFLDEHLGPPT